MNTVKIGDKFEDKSYSLIHKAIENGELGIQGSRARVFQKKGYYSKDREKEIIFDLSIEVWPENAERYILLFLIECKSSNSKAVPVDDVEEFYTKITQVAGVNVKGVMISDNSFQSGGLTFAKNKGMMLIEVNDHDNHSIILHRTEKDEAKNDELDLDKLFAKFIKKTLGLKRVKGLKRLSTKDIELITHTILEKFNGGKSSINIPNFITFLKSNYDLEFDFNSELQTVNGKNIQGYFDAKDKKILIDKSISENEKFPFVFGHEVGHFFLHSMLKINQDQYNDFADPEYNFHTDKYTLKNHKNWIEWQANAFSVSLFLPRHSFMTHLIAFRKSIGISRPEHIYLDNQSINRQDFYRTVDYLSKYFSASKAMVINRMESLELITYGFKKSDIRSIIREIIIN